MILFDGAARRRLACLASLALTAFGPGATARAEPIRAHYTLSLIGLPIGTASVTGSVEPTSYKIEVNARLAGLASLLSSSKAAAVSTGVFSGNHLAPTSYATTSASPTMTRTLRMAMNAGTVTGVDISPPFDARIPRVPVTEADKRDILDPLSALVMTVPGPNSPVGPASCNRTLPIFDGATRFEIELSFVGIRHVKTKGFEGDTAVCSARYKPISGHRVDVPSTKYMADNKGLEVWLAPVAGTHVLFPYRIAVQTMVGTTVIEADEFAMGDDTHAAVAR